MATIPTTWIAEEKAKIQTVLTRAEAQVAKLRTELAGLEGAERLLARYTGVKTPAAKSTAPKATPVTPSTTSKATPATPKAAPPPAPGARRGRPPSAGKPAPSGQISLADAALKAVGAGYGTAADIIPYVLKTFGMTVRPNHMGIALARLSRAGRLIAADGRWSLPVGQAVAA